MQHGDKRRQTPWMKLREFGGYAINLIPPIHRDLWTRHNLTHLSNNVERKSAELLLF